MFTRRSKPDLHAAALPWALALSLAGACSADAQGAGPHVHGLARLLLAYDQGTLELQLTAPAESLVGFEHPPGNVEEASAVAGAEAILNDPARVFRPEGAVCELDEMQIENPFADAAGGHHTADGSGHSHHTEEGHRDAAHEDGGHDNDHATDHDNGHEHEHEHEHDQHDHETTSTHTDFVAEYRLECEGSKAPRSIGIMLFEHFPRLERVTLEWLLPESSGSSDLTADKPRQVLN